MRERMGVSVELHIRYDETDVAEGKKLNTGRFLPINGSSCCIDQSTPNANGPRQIVVRADKISHRPS